MSSQIGYLAAHASAGDLQTLASDEAEAKELKRAGLDEEVKAGMAPPVLGREQEVRPCPAEICAEGVGSTAAPGPRILTLGLAACPQVLHLCALCLYGVRGRESE